MIFDHFLLLYDDRKILKSILAAISLIGILTTVIISQSSFVDAAISCSRDCTPPTLGVTDNGRRVIENGFMINDKSFNVESHSQSIPTQVFKTGDKVTIKLTGYENSGISNMRHVTLAITDYNNKHDYHDKAKISIDHSFDGAVTRNVADATGLLDKVNVKAQRIDSFTGTLTISFVVAKPLNTSSITVHMWDAGLSTNTNIFEDAIQVVGK